MTTRSKKTPYERLGVSKDANPDAVRKAFRRKARETHPDRGGDKEEFQRVQSSYPTLIDPERRKRYDETGNDEPEARVQQTPLELLLMELLSKTYDTIQTTDNLKYTDVPQVMIDIATIDMKDARETLAKLPQRLRDLKDAVDRLTDGQGLLKSIILKQIDASEKAKEHLTARIESLKNAMAYLRTCSYRKEPQRDYQRPWSKSSTLSQW